MRTWDPRGSGPRGTSLGSRPPLTTQFDHVGWEVLTSAGVAANYTLLTQPSQLALPRMVADGVLVDAVFVDGSHVFHDVFVDLHFLRELVRPGGMIVLDDCQWASVATVAQYFVRNTAWQSSSFQAGHGSGRSAFPIRPCTPRFDTFRPFDSPPQT